MATPLSYDRNDKNTVFRTLAMTALLLELVACSRTTVSPDPSADAAVRGAPVPTVAPATQALVKAAETAKSRVDAALTQAEPECTEAEKATATAKARWKNQQDIVDRLAAEGAGPSRQVSNAARALRLAFDTANTKSSTLCGHVVALKHYSSLCSDALSELRTALAPSRAEALVGTVNDAADRAEEVVGKARKPTLRTQAEAGASAPVDKATCPGATKVIATHSRGCLCNDGDTFAEVALLPTCAGALAIGNKNRCETQCQLENKKQASGKNQ